MEEQLVRFPEQFAWRPAYEGGDGIPEVSHYILAGMGGSALGAKLLFRQDPTLPLSIHSDYGLPRIPADTLRDSLIIASSYSGETEETLSAAKYAVEAGLPVAVVTTGGRLADFARERNLPLLLFTNPGIEPRMAIGYTMLAIATLMKNGALETAVRDAGRQTNAEAGRTLGESIANLMDGKIPFVYSSGQNAGVSYFWKIAHNETAKIPAVSNVFPELCHNELSGYDLADSTRNIFSALHAVFLEDDDDHPRVKLRMKLMHELLMERGVESSRVKLVGDSGLHKAFNGLLTGVWSALSLARRYGVPDAKTPLIAEFKKRMAEHP
ncbi:MAG: hypothetical protein KGI41_01350 [Patescibacteria group bacterium]|nr:hypothetical protein [Patescibacteria group bacterium]MDE1965873.1 hypothetical protein [Patescibacteria group bacterium]